MSHKLHEILAVEKDLMNTSKRLLAESIRTFNKDNLFKGSLKEVEMFEASDENDLATTVAPEHVKLETTVHQILDYTVNEIGRYWNAVASKDLSNMNATADIVLASGTVLAEKVPATFLLGLETKLNDLINLFTAIPTLEPGRTWEPDPSLGVHIFKDTHPQEKFKTRKNKEFRSIASATKEHKEQIAELDITTNIGRVIQTNWSGAITTSDKSYMIRRCRALLSAVKQARQRANASELIQSDISLSLLKYVVYGE